MRTLPVTLAPAFRSCVGLVELPANSIQPFAPLAKLPVCVPPPVNDRTPCVTLTEPELLNRPLIVVFSEPSVAPADLVSVPWLMKVPLLKSASDWISRLAPALLVRRPLPQ